MSRFAFLSTVAILCAAAAPPASAQAANSEPGYCAQFYPNDDCNSVGPETPGSRTEGKAVESEKSAATSPVRPPASAPAPRKQKHRSDASIAHAK
jgi:hypothetical protein